MSDPKVIAVSLDPPQFQDKDGNSLELKQYPCPVHGTNIGYVEVDGEKIPVMEPESEENCKAWRAFFPNVFKGQQKII